ncbi:MULTISPECIES: AAA family ATPase [unclassified Streptococcus]|uniref:AAA family ATPase n=1 Tax=unclassified Streptococcus TaxID=2608887 RepID=UPI001D15EAAA|nr:MULTISPECIES: AAA family ATPase [unclassified Streptococcus]
MEILPRGAYKEYGSSSLTRWDVLKKDVVYCDCKEYVSAFDLFFYHCDFSKTKTQKKKQDLIRKMSRPLAKVLKSGELSYKYYRQEMIHDNLVIDKEVCDKVSYIMGENYSDIKIITHNFYTRSSRNKASKTIWIKKNGMEYSEAFAGTGEARVILLVNDILNAPDKSLVLIDEPEISLHPGAIYRLKNFILNQVKEKKHQVVITTHSIHLVKDFPKEAIKLVSKINDRIRILENVEFQDAFFELGEEHRDKKLIYVEDKLVKSLIEFVIDREANTDLRKNFRENIIVRYLVGGAEQMIKNNIVPSAAEKPENKYYWLDGDKKRSFEGKKVIQNSYMEKGKVNPINIPEAKNSELNDIIKEITGIGNLGFSYSGDKEELPIVQREFIDYWFKYVDFLPFVTPELELAKLDASKSGSEYDFSNDPNGKIYFKEKTKDILGISTVKSEDIFYEQRRAMGNLSKDDELCINIKNMLENLF